MKQLSGARCRVCHRLLTDEVSLALGIGPTCRAKAARFGVNASQAHQCDHGTEDQAQQARAAMLAAKVAKAERLCALRAANLMAIEARLREMRALPTAARDLTSEAYGAHLADCMRREMPRLYRVYDALKAAARRASSRHAA